MAKSNFTDYDLNKHRKVYSFLRHRRQIAVIDKDGFKIEIGVVTFTSSSETSATFAASFSSVPTVTAVMVDSLGNSQANVNVYVKSLNASAVTFATSASGSFDVHYHAISS